MSREVSRASELRELLFRIDSVLLASLPATGLFDVRDIIDELPLGVSPGRPNSPVADDAIRRSGAAEGLRLVEGLLERALEGREVVPLADLAALRRLMAAVALGDLGDEGDAWSNAAL